MLVPPQDQSTAARPRRPRRRDGWARETAAPAAGAAEAGVCPDDRRSGIGGVLARRNGPLLLAQTDRADRRPPRRRSAGAAYARRSMNAHTYRTASGRGARPGRDGRWVLFGVGEGIAGSLGAAEVPDSVLGASGGRWDIGRFARWSLLGLVVGGACWRHATTSADSGSRLSHRSNRTARQRRRARCPCDRRAAASGCRASTMSPSRAAVGDHIGPPRTMPTAENTRPGAISRRPSQSPPDL